MLASQNNNEVKEKIKNGGSSRMEDGEVDGALREAREKIAFLKQQLADLSDAVSYASDGSRDMTLDPLPDLDPYQANKGGERGFAPYGSFDSRASRSSRGSRTAHGDSLGNPLYKDISNDVEPRNPSPLRPELHIAEGRMGSVDSEVQEKRIDDGRQLATTVESEASGRRIVSPFARFATVEFQQTQQVEETGKEEEDGEVDQWNQVATESTVKVSSEDGEDDEEEDDNNEDEDDDDVFHSPRFFTGKSNASSSTDDRPTSPEESSSPQEPLQTPRKSLRQGNEAEDMVGPKPTANGRQDFIPNSERSPNIKFQMPPKPQASIDSGSSGFFSQGSGVPPDPDVEFERDAVAWILYSLGSYITWPGKNKQKSPIEAQLPSSYIASQLGSQEYSGPQISSNARIVREHTAKLWEARGVEMIEELWELIAGLIESQDHINTLSAKSCWFSGRSLHSAADGLPFAFTVHTFTAPGVPCTIGRANVSAEVCCSDTRKVPQCIMPLDKADEEGANSGSNSALPDPPEESSPVKRSLSGQLVNGHFIATHSSLEQHPARVVDASLEVEPNAIRRQKVARRPSAEIAEISLGNHLRKSKSSGPDLRRRPRRTSREDTFSFHSETSSTSSNSDRGVSPVPNDHLGTADLTAFIRSPEEARPLPENTVNRSPSGNSSPADEFDAGTADLIRDDAASVGTESESLSFHNRATTSRISNEQFDTADLSGFVSPRDKDRLATVDEGEKSAVDLVADPPQGSGIPPSFGAVDLVWEVRYVTNGNHTTAVVEMTPGPSDSEDEGTVRTWLTYPGDSDGEESEPAQPSLFIQDSGSGASGSDEKKDKRDKISHRTTQSADMEILRSVSLKGFLANQAEQRKNSRKRLENVETVAEIESVGSASSRKQMSSPTARRGRPPLARPPRGGFPTGERKTDKKPPVSSGSRKEMLSKDKHKDKPQKKTRLPKFSKLVRRVRTFIGGRSKPEYHADIETARGCKSERVLPHPDRVLDSAFPVQELLSERVMRMPSESEDPEPPAQVDTPLSRQMSVESIPVPDTARGMEMVIHNGSGDPNVVQDAFWGFPASVSLPVKDLSNGRYLVMGHLAGEGQYEISVKVGGKHVLDSPLQFMVVPPSMLGSGITPDGPFYPHPDLPFYPSETTALSPHPRFPPCHSVSYDAQRLEYACRHPHVGCVDLLFAVDATASMTAEIAELPSVVRELSTLISEVHLCKRVRFGVIGYRDHWPEDDHAFVLSKLDFTEDVSKVCSFILSLKASGGGDYPEAFEAALLDAAEGVSWWPFSTRLVIWVGDAPPHGYEGMGPRQAMEHEEAFLQAKERVKQLQAAAAVDAAQEAGSSSRWTELDAELSAALRECDKLAMYHDNFPLGVPGGVRWEEASVRLEAVGARVIAVGLRDAIYHAPSQACLRSIAHLTGGALLEVGNLHGSVVGPLTTAIVEQQLDQQLVEEEVCDLLICMREDLKHHSPQECQKTIIEVMNRAKKLPHRLQVLPSDSERHDDKLEDALDQVDHRMLKEGSVSSDTANPGGENLAIVAEGDIETQSLLLGMQSVELRDKILEQVLKGIRSKAESVGLALQAGFGTRSSWLETLGSGLSDISGVHGRRAHKRIAEEVLTSPVALRYLLAEKSIAELLASGVWPRACQ